MKKRLLALFLALLITLSPAQAFAEIDLGLKDISGAWYSDEADCSEYNTDLGTFDGIATAGLSKLQSEFVDKYHDIAANLGQQYKIPWETVVAQGIIESASGTSYFAEYRNNFFGIGAFDSNPSAARSYSSVESGWKGYFENIKNTPTYRNHGVFSGKTTTDPIEYLKAIKAAGYATDPNYVSKVGSIVKAIEKRSQTKGWQSSAELNRVGATSLSSATNLSSDICLSNNLGLGNMNINKTAIKLAWPANSGDHACDDVKAEYKKALIETKAVKNFGGCNCKNSTGCRWRNFGTSCSVYVSTVLRYSGVAPDAARSPGGLLEYMKSRPHIFTEITQGYNKNNMQAGDIQVYEKPGTGGGDGHARLVVRTDDGKFHIAEAHLYGSGGKPPQINTKEYNGSAKGYHVFRAKNNRQTSSISDNVSNLRSNGSSSIGKTALQLAWPLGSSCTSKSTPEYYKARMAVGISTDKKINHSKKYACAGIGASCDRFVGVVIRYSGVDPKAGKWVCKENDSNENCLLARALAHPDIYEEVTNGYSDAKARDGDILLRPGHAWVIAKLPDGKLYRVEASYSNCCTGRVTRKYKYSPTESGQRVRIFRAKNNTSVECQCQSTEESQAGNGNINKTALDLAWPTYRQHSLYDPKPAYKKALAAVGLNHYGEKWVNIGASCDAFVATVMRYSGVDPKFPCCGAANQMNYLASHPEKYKRIPNTGGTSNLQPGDIRVHSGHIEIVVKREDGSFGIAAASHADRTADVNSFYSNPRAQIYRSIK